MYNIGFLYEHPGSQFLEDELALVRETGLNVEGVNLKRFLNDIDLVKNLEFLYCAKDKKVMKDYLEITTLCKEFQIVVIYGTLKLTPRYIKDFFEERTVIFWATDDPVSTSFATLPYACVSDIILTQTPLLNEEESFTKYLSEILGKHVYYQPFGYLDGWRNGKSDKDILNSRKEIDVSFVGSPSWRKDMLLDCKRYFGRRMKIYSKDWSFLRHLHYDFIKHGVLHRVPKAVNESEIYFKSLLSINSNAYGGPSTSRTFHLPICGAIQACDFRDGLALSFDVDKHLVAYKNLDSNDLISKLDKVLSSSKSEQTDMRDSAYFHVKNNYRFSQLIEKRLKNLLNSKIVK
ncbi:glycosyltransferase [bacterium]|nr:glycosyltransferase [bacterium]